MADPRANREIAGDLHNAALAVIEVGRQVLHATRPDWDAWAVTTAEQIKALAALSDELRARADELRSRIEGHAR